MKFIHRIRIILANFFFMLSVWLEPEIDYNKEYLEQVESEVDKMLLDKSIKTTVKGFSPISTINKHSTTTDQDMDDMVRGFLIGKEDKK